MSLCSGRSNRSSRKAGSSQHIMFKDTIEKPVILKCIPDLQAKLFAFILSDASAQLQILSECNNELRILKTMADMEDLLARKFYVKKNVDMDPLAKINPENLGSDQYKLDKLVTDRAYLADVLHYTLVDMYANNSFNNLKATNKGLEEAAVYRINLIEEEERNRINRRESSRQLRQQRNHIKTVLYDTNLTIENLKCQVEDTELNSQVRSRYIESWERARTEQHHQKILDKETGPSESIQYYQNRTDQEQRIHTEVELLVNISINETLAKVEQWMNKFDTDMEAQDLKIAKIKNKYQDALQRRQELEERYAKHEVLMKNWLKFKKDREDALAYWNKMQNSAIIVQAWWRGILVRLQLGPYKKSKRRPKAGTAEEMGKKKKK